MSRDREKNGWDREGGLPAGHVDDWDELIVDYLDGRLDPEARVAVKRHLQECPDCADRAQIQQRVISFLQETGLEDPPEDLEYRVLGEILFPSQPVMPAPVAEPDRWARWWRQRVRPWVPVSVAVAALLVAVVAYGVVKSGSSQSVTDREPGVSSTATGGKVAGAGSTQGSDQFGAAETTAGAPGASSTTAGATSTTAAGVTTTSPAALSTASASTIAAPTDDKKAMVSNLRAAHAPAYIVFAAANAAPAGDGQQPTPMTTIPGETTTTAGSTVSREQADAVASQMVSLTGLQPLDPALSMGGPTFAAFVPTNDATQLVDFVRSIAVSAGLTVSLSFEAPAGAGDAVGRLLASKTELPILRAQRVPQPAVSGYEFTTSTWIPADGTAEGVPPDQAGTHVLVIFYVQP